MTATQIALFCSVHQMMISVRAPVRFVLSHYLCTRPLCLPGGQSAVEWIFTNNVSNPIVQIVSKLSRYFQIISNFQGGFKTVQIQGVPNKSHSEFDVMAVCSSLILMF